MISEAIMEAIGDTQALERIRPDLNIEKWSIWQPAKSKNAPIVRVFEREVTLDDGSKLTAQVKIGFTDEGTLTTEDQKTYYALVKCWGDKGYSTDKTVCGLRELAKFLKRKWGTNVIDSITGSLTRLRVTPIIWRNSYYDSATGETIKELRPFTILSNLKIIQKENDGVVNRAVGYFQFDEHIITNLLNNHTKPLLFDTAISFKSEIAQLLYPRVDLVMADKYRYERRTKGLFDDLGLKGKEYVYLSARKRRLEPALKEMEGKPLTTGLLTKAALEKTSDGIDYKVVFEKKARRKLRKKIRSTQPSPVQNEQDSIGLAEELDERGIKPKRVGVELCQNYDENRIREKIKMFDAGIIEDAGGLRRAIEEDWQPSKRQIKESKVAVRQQMEEQVRELEREKDKIKKPYGEECNQIFQKIIAENAGVVDEAMQEALKTNPILVQFYEESKPYADQRTMVQAAIRPKLRERFPDMFKAVDEKYGQQIEKIDKQIADLQMK